MSHHPFRPSELDRPSTDANRAGAELERYTTSSAADAPHGFDHRVMGAIGAEPAPRRGLLAWLLVPSAAGGGFRQFAPVGAVAATVVLAVAGALFAGQLADMVRNVGSGSPTASPSPSASESVQPSPTTSPAPSTTGTPDASPGDEESSGPNEQETSGSSGDGVNEDGTMPSPATLDETPEQSHGGPG